MKSNQHDINSQRQISDQSSPELRGRIYLQIIVIRLDQIVMNHPERSIDLEPLRILLYKIASDIDQSNQPTCNNILASMVPQRNRNNRGMATLLLECRYLGAFSNYIAGLPANPLTAAVIIAELMDKPLYKKWNESMIRSYNVYAQWSSMLKKAVRQ